MVMARPTPKQIRSLLRYDRKRGLFRWRRPTARQAPGWFKGNKSVRTYRRLYIDGHHYLAHVIAFVIVEGRWPRFEVKHRSRNFGDNRWSNLREATHAQVTYSRRINKNNTTGHRGVSRFGKRFRSVVICKRRRLSLGLFDDPSKAAAKWQSAAKGQYGEHLES
jgi:hypothetical protein